jgi:hypothetical protein
VLGRVIGKSRVKDGRRRKKRIVENRNGRMRGKEKGKRQGKRQETWPKKEGYAIRRGGGIAGGRGRGKSI